MSSSMTGQTGCEDIEARLRFRVDRDVRSKPDLVFPGRRKVIFIHGCFWHQHPDPNCRDARSPRSRTEYWGPKLQRNVERDAEHVARLEAIGWRVLVMWECELRDRDKVVGKLRSFLG